MSRLGIIYLVAVSHKHFLNQLKNVLKKQKMFDKF